MNVAHRDDEVAFGTLLAHGEFRVYANIGPSSIGRRQRWQLPHAPCHVGQSGGRERVLRPKRELDLRVLAYTLPLMGDVVILVALFALVIAGARGAVRRRPTRKDPATGGPDAR